MVHFYGSRFGSSAPIAPQAAHVRLTFWPIYADRLDFVEVHRLMFRLQRITGRLLPTPAAQPIRQPQDSCQTGRAQRQPPKRQTNWTIVESDIGVLCAW